MSDWEEYEDGAATKKSAPTQWKLTVDDCQKGNAYFGVRKGASFGARREDRTNHSGEVLEFRSRREDRYTSGGPPGERRTFVDAKSDSSPPVTITVENASVGRVIGVFLTLK